jgi:hypothetical protein
VVISHFDASFGHVITGSLTVISSKMCPSFHAQKSLRYSLNKFLDNKIM